MELRLIQKIAVSLQLVLFINIYLMHFSKEEMSIFLWIFLPDGITVQLKISIKLKLKDRGLAKYYYYFCYSKFLITSVYFTRVLQSVSN